MKKKLKVKKQLKPLKYKWRATHKIVHDRTFLCYPTTFRPRVWFCWNTCENVDKILKVTECSRDIIDITSDIRQEYVTIWENLFLKTARQRALWDD